MESETAGMAAETILDRGAGVALRGLVPADAGPIALYAGDRRVAWMTGTIPHPYPPGAAEAFVEAARSGRRAEEVWAIDGSGSGREAFMGLIGWRPAIAEIGYWVGPPYWSTGVASAAVETLTRHLLAAGVPRIEAVAFDDNPASARVLEKAGFRPVGPTEGYSVARGAMVPGTRYRLLPEDRR